MIESLTDREREVLDLLAEGLTNREIAQRLVLSAETVKWYNSQIYQKLGVGNRTEAVAVGRRYGLLEGEGDGAAAGAERDGGEAGGTLPRPLTSFVGREKEIREIGQLMRSQRLLTLTGPGGTGKTRLALEVAGHEGRAYGDGVAFVDLAAVEEAEEVGPAMVRGLGLREAGQAGAQAGARKVLARYLRPRQMLLILDNFEQVVEAAPLVGELLEAAPRITVLATSREPLRLYGEQEYRLGPLPAPEGPTAPEAPEAALKGNEAVRLFLERAQAVRPDFELTVENAGAVAAICRRLEGLPLAIELAAVQLKLFSPEALLARLEDRLDVPARGARDRPARQRTLRATIDWSHALLSSEERILFRRLAVFRGGASLEAVEAVCGVGGTWPEETQAVEVVSALLDKSLIRREVDEEGRVRVSMLETIRAYAWEKLAMAGDEEAMRRAHAGYFLTLAQGAAPDVRAGPRQYMWVRRLMADYENVRAALKWAFDSDEGEMGAAMVGALGHFWFRSGLHWEGLRWTERALEVVGDVPLAVQGRVYRAAGIMAWPTRSHERGRGYDEKALAIYRELEDEHEVAWSLVQLAAQWIGEKGGYEAAGPMCREGLAVLREMDDKAGVAQALNVLGELARIDRHDELARGYYEEALEIARATGDRLREVLQLQNLGFLAQRAGAHGEAEGLFREAIMAAGDLNSRYALAYALMSLAGAYVVGRPERAARLIGAAERVFEELGALADRGDREVFAGNEAAAREALGEEAYAAAAARGRGMSLEEAVAYALGEG